MSWGSNRQNQEKSRPFVIPIFLPHAGCPHRCLFCNQRSITGIKRNKLTPEKLQSQIDTFLTHKRPHRKPVQIAFFGGNFLGQDSGVVKNLLMVATRFVKNGRADTIRFSTRPDTIDQKRLDFLKNFPVSTIELGVQSMDDQVLAISRRGHSRLDTEKAVDCLKSEGYEIGLQIMVGLPGDSFQKTLTTGERVVDLKPDFVRIYPTVVLAGSPLAKWFKTGQFKPLSLEACITQVKHLFHLFNLNNIQVIRMGLQASEGLADGSTIVAGPYHPAFGHLIYSEIFLDKAVRAIESRAMREDTVTISVNPLNISKMRGLKNGNIAKLKRRFCLKSVEIVPNPELDDNCIKVDDGLPGPISELPSG